MPRLVLAQSLCLVFFLRYIYLAIPAPAQAHAKLPLSRSFVVMQGKTLSWQAVAWIVLLHLTRSPLDLSRILKQCSSNNQSVTIRRISQKKHDCNNDCCCMRESAEMQKKKNYESQTNHAYTWSLRYVSPNTTYPLPLRPPPRAIPLRFTSPLIYCFPYLPLCRPNPRFDSLYITHVLSAHQASVVP